MVLPVGGIGDPKTGVLVDAGLLEFNTEGGLPNLQKMVTRRSSINIFKA